MFRGVNKPINSGYRETLKQFGADGYRNRRLYAPNFTKTMFEEKDER